MSVYISCVVAWMLFALTKRYASKLKSPDTANKFTASNLVKTSFTSYLKKVCFIAAVTYSVFAILIFFLNTFSSAIANQAVAGFLFNKLIAMKLFYNFFDEDWKWISLVILIGFAIAIIYRIIKFSTTSLIKKLVDDYNAGNLEELPDSDEMEKINLQIRDFQKKLH